MSAVPPIRNTVIISDLHVGAGDLDDCDSELEHQLVRFLGDIGSRHTMTTRAPNRASARAVSRPIPELAPVIKQIRSFRAEDSVMIQPFDEGPEQIIQRTILRNFRDFDRSNIRQSR